MKESVTSAARAIEEEAERERLAALAEQQAKEAKLKAKDTKKPAAAKKEAKESKDKKKTEEKDQEKKADDKKADTDKPAAHSDEKDKEKEKEKEKPKPKTEAPKAEKTAEKKAPAPAATPAKKKPTKGKKGQEDVDENKLNAPVFSVEPSSIDLAVGEAREIVVWAFPQAVGQYDDALICTIRNNPTPVVFSLSCQGARPVLELSTQEIKFDRLLIGQQETRVCNLVNTTAIPVAWALSGTEQLTQEFKIQPGFSGVVPPLSTLPLQFEFKALEQKTFDHALTLNVSDTDNIMGVVASKPIQLIAEAFKMDAKVTVPEKGLDFGTIRVGDTQEQEMSIGNDGKYDIKFSFDYAEPSKALFSDILTITPANGTLKPGQHIKATVSCKCKQELDIFNNCDLKLLLVEGGTDKVVRTLSLPLSLRAVFSQFRVAPVHGLVFGPLEVRFSP